MNKNEIKPCNILCVADHVDPIVYSGAVKERFKHIDLILSCGDLKSDYYDFIVSSLNKPFLYVLGNHSTFTLKKGIIPSSASWEKNPRPGTFQGGVLLEGNVRYLKEHDLIVAGLGGSRKYSNGDNQYTEWEMMFRILRLIPKLYWNRIARGRYLDIFLTHASPRNVNDREDNCHKGFKVFKWFLRRFRPRYQIHGHIHLYDLNANRSTHYGSTEVMNAYDHIELQWLQTTEMQEEL